MSSDATIPAPSADPVVAFTIAQRKNLAYALLAAGLLALGVGIYFTYKAWPASTAAKEAEKDPAADPDKPDLLKDKDKETTLTGQSGHVLWAIAGYMFGVVFLGVGLMLIAGVPKPTLAQQESDARVVLLALGGLTGLALMIVAAYVFVSSFKDLVKWVDEQTAPEGAVKLVAGLFTFLVGAGIAFLATMPARAEERHNPFLRRLVYGTNVGLLSILVLLLLLVGNVLAAVKVPARLDTTEAGFHSLTLSSPTKEYLAGLTQPVTAYTTYPEDSGRIAADARRLLAAMHDVNPSMFRVRYLSPTLNRNEIETLRNRFPQADPSLSGILITVGEDEKQYSFIKTADLTEQDFTNPRRPQVSFQGEKKVVGELLFLSENKTKPVVYFLTGHGELEVFPAAQGPDAQGKTRSASRLRAELEKASVDIRPLAFEAANPKVPDDAAILVIADPRSPIPPEQIEAIRRYLTPTTPRGDKKGKLIVMSGPTPNPDGTGVVETNLNGLLGDYGVNLGGRYIYTMPMQQYGYQELIGMVTQEASDAKNPIAMEYLPPRGAMLWNCQEVRPARAQPGAQYTAKALLVSEPPSRVTWLEDSPVANPEKALKELAANPELIRQKNATESRGRVLATVISEGATARIAVFGSGDSFADDQRRSRYVGLNAQLVTLTVNWLRDRPPVANIATKPYGLYMPNEKTSEVQVFWLPVAVTLAGVIALGLGVWVFRRK